MGNHWDQGECEGRWSEREDRDDGEAGHSGGHHQGLLELEGGGGGRAWQAWWVAPWKLPVVVFAIVVPVIAAFLLGGPGFGVALGALAGVAIVVVAARRPPRGKIGQLPAAGSRRLLVVISRAVEDAEAIAAIAAEAGGPAPAGSAEVIVLAPARIGFLDRWASDLERARREAQQRLVISVASLAKAGVVAEARVGDEDLVQAVEDQLGSFPATEVILVTGAADRDPAGEQAALDLGERLRAEFRRIVVSDPAAG